VVGGRSDLADVPAAKVVEPVAQTRYGRAELLGSDDLGGQRFDQWVGEDELRTIVVEAVGDEVGGEQDDWHGERGGVTDFHAHAVVETGSVQDGEQSGLPGQAMLVEFEQPAALHLGDEVFFVGVAEWEEHRLGAHLVGEPARDKRAERAIVRCE
jgi:hypothetical protein